MSDRFKIKSACPVSFPSSCLMAFEAMCHFIASNMQSSIASLGVACEGLFSGCKGWFDLSHNTLLLKKKNGEETATKIKASSGSEL